MKHNKEITYIEQLKIGQKVYYVPFDLAPKSLCENGIIKDIPDQSSGEVWVVYNCNDEWENFMNYTSQLTSISQLKLGWI